MDRNNEYIRTHRCCYTLHNASKHGHDSCLKRLLTSEDNRAKIDEKDFFGYTPLHHASMEGKNECMKILFDHGANPYEKDTNFGKTAFEVAKHGNTQFLDMYCADPIKEPDS